MTPPTKEQLDEIRRLEREATPEPWVSREVAIRNAEAMKRARAALGDAP